MIIEVVYTPRETSASRALTIPPSLAPGGQTVVATSPPASARESIALPIPDSAVDPSSWSIASSSDDVEFTLRTVVVGKTRQLLLVANSLGPFPFATATLRTSFSGQSVSSVNPAPLTAALPEPPAGKRVVYTAGDQVFTLDASGFSDPFATRLIHHGEELSLGGVIDEKLWFYAPYRWCATDETDTIFVAPDSASPSPAAAARSAFVTLAPASSEVAVVRRQVIERNDLYERSAPMPLGERFVAYRLFQGNETASSLALSDVLTTDSIRLEIELIGLTTAANSPEHFATFTVDGEDETLNAAWGGRASYTAILHLNPPSSGGMTKSIPGRRTLTLRHSIPVSSIANYTDVQNLDKVVAVYTGWPRAVAGVGRLELPSSPDGLPRRVSIGGFSPGTASAGILLLDVTNPARPIRLASPPVFVDSEGNAAIEFEAPSAACSFHAQRLSDIPSSLGLQDVSAMPVPPPGILRGIYVREDSLAASLQPLLLARGPGFMELDPEAAYCAWNGGQSSPESIRFALSDIIAAAMDRVPFPAVVLVGHGTFDPRNELGSRSGCQVPTFIEESIDTGFTTENSIDYPYGLLSGDDEFQDAAVGRLPARTPEELDIVVSRILAQENLAPFLTEIARPALFVIDDDPEVMEDAALWPSLWSPTQHRSHSLLVDPLSDGTTEREALKSFLEAPPHGPALVFYSGHGSTTLWGDERILDAENLPLIDTDQGWPLVATFTCLNGSYAVPGAAQRTLGEQWLFVSEDRGAIACIVPCSVDFYANQREFAVEFLQILASAGPDRPVTVGELMTLTHNAHAMQFPDNGKTNRLYLLFGDPSSPLTIDPVVVGASSLSIF